MPLTPGIVGRERELSLLDQMLNETARGQGGVLLLSGDGGIGKTRLASELAKAAKGKGWKVMVGRAYALETAIPYAPFADACEPELAAVDENVRLRLTRGDRAVLTTLAPSLVSSGPADPRADTSSGDEQSVRLHSGIVQLLARFAEKQPLLMVLENLHWADSSTVKLFHFLARHVGAHRILLVGTWNETERELTDGLRTMVRSLRSLNVARDVRLEALAVEAVAQLVAQRFEVEPTSISTFIAELHRATRGNPFFIEQVLADLVALGTLRKAGSAWVGWEFDQLSLPHSVLDVMKSRLERLSPGARQVAGIIAVSGVETELQVVRRVMGDSDGVCDEDALLAAIDELRANSIIVEKVENAVAYDIAHPMLRQTLDVEIVGRARGQALHARIATALESWYGERAERHAEQIAAHWRRSDPHVNAREAVRWLLLAGHQAMERVARPEAALAFNAALERADKFQDLVDQEIVPELLDQLSRLYRRLGKYQQAITICTRARDMALARGDQVGVAVAERRLGLAHEGLGQRREAIQHFDVGIRIAREAGDATLLARLLLTKGDSWQALGQPEEARREILQALDLAEQIGETELLARTHRSLLKLHTWSGPAHRAWAHAHSAVEMAERSGARNLAWSAHWTTAVLAGLTSNTIALKSHLERATKLADELNSPLLQLRTAEISIEFRSGIGEWDRALVEGERAIAAARALDQTTMLARLLYWVGTVYLHRGEMAEAQKLFDESWAVSGAGSIDPSQPFEVHGVLPAYSARVMWLNAIGEHERAIALGQEALVIADRTGYVAWAVYRLIPAIAESALVLDKHEVLLDLRARLARDAELLAHAVGRGWVSVIEGELAIRDGSLDVAAACLQQAVSTLMSVPFPFDAARTRLRLARVLQKQGNNEDAIIDARAALQVFEKLGARPSIEEASAVLASLGKRPPARKGSSASFENLTPKEFEVVKQVARRLTNKEIGAKLTMSDRTVGTHLRNIFDKLGVRDRTALGDLAREHGLHLDA